MDLRVKKTRKNIINAFLLLRAKKPLEKISIKELSQKAEINKSTFYLHYKDIYDLSEHLENELIDNIVTGVECPEAVVSNPRQFADDLADAFISNETLMNILFSSGRDGLLAVRLEKRLTSLVFEKYPQYMNDKKVNIVLTYVIKGCYYAFLEHRDYDMTELLQTIGAVTECITQRFVN